MEVAEDWVDCGMEAEYYDYQYNDPLPVNATFNEPGIPFLHHLKQRLIPNSNFIIEGSLFDNANSFSIDLCKEFICPRDNVIKKYIAFHFNPRLAMNCVVRNSKTDYWGREEIRTFRRNPFKKGAHFIIEVFVAPKEYLVSVNGKHFCTFGHRIPTMEVSSIEINGDITLNKVELTATKYYPSIETKEEKKDTLEMPFCKHLEHSLKLPKLMVLRGTVYLLPFQFHVNLQCGNYVYPHPLIAYHMNVRWQPSHEDVVVFNSWTINGWDAEEVVPMRNVFQPGADFEIQIKIDQTGFTTMVNGKLLKGFRHRMKPELIDTIHVQGDVQLNRADLH